MWGRALLQVLYYAATIFQAAGFSGAEEATQVSALLSVVSPSCCSGACVFFDSRAQAAMRACLFLKLKRTVAGRGERALPRALLHANLGSLEGLVLSQPCLLRPAATQTQVSLVLGAFKLAMTCVAVATVDSWGRRPLLLVRGCLPPGQQSLCLFKGSLQPAIAGALWGLCPESSAAPALWSPLPRGARRPSAPLSPPDRALQRGVLCGSAAGAFPSSPCA